MSSEWRLRRIVSGGQTGVDRAALDVALELGWPCGGWCPAGRLAEDGPLDSRYPLQETGSRRYSQRTRWNVRDSDATLILASGQLTGGTALTQSFAIQLGRPCMVADPQTDADVERVRQWLLTHPIETLNIAGPRESTVPGIEQLARRFLVRLLTAQG